MSTLNAATLPLSGRHLIEASAGTGKTFTVANLYLRLLIEAQHTAPPTVENILVVTFTNAAAIHTLQQVGFGESRDFVCLVSHTCTFLTRSTLFATRRF